MSTKGSILKVLIEQARVNSKLITALGAMVRNLDLGDDRDAVIDILVAANEHSVNFVNALDAAVSDFEGDSHG